ncbi:MAG: hypothetical protein V6Z82_07005 [Flavobacteriales bacterium]
MDLIESKWTREIERRIGDTMGADFERNKNDVINGQSVLLCSDELILIYRNDFDCCVLVLLKGKNPESAIDKFYKTAKSLYYTNIRFYSVRGKALCRMFKKYSPYYSGKCYNGFYEYIIEVK